MAASSTLTSSGVCPVQMTQTFSALSLYSRQPSFGHWCFSQNCLPSRCFFLHCRLPLMNLHLAATYNAGWFTCGGSYSTGNATDGVDSGSSVVSITAGSKTSASTLASMSGSIFGRLCKWAEAARPRIGRNDMPPKGCSSVAALLRRELRRVCSPTSVSSCFPFRFFIQNATKIRIATTSNAAVTPPATPAALLLLLLLGKGARVSVKFPSKTCCQTSGFAETKMRACSRPELLAGD